MLLGLSFPSWRDRSTSPLAALPSVFGNKLQCPFVFNWKSIFMWNCTGGSTYVIPRLFALSFNEWCWGKKIIKTKVVILLYGAHFDNEPWNNMLVFRRMIFLFLKLFFGHKDKQFFHVIKTWSWQPWITENNCYDCHFWFSNCKPVIEYNRPISKVLEPKIGRLLLKLNV